MIIYFSIVFSFLDGKYLALVCEFSLEPSSYATMALREIMHSDTASGFQTELSQLAKKDEESSSSSS